MNAFSDNRPEPTQGASSTADAPNSKDATTPAVGTAEGKDKDSLGVKVAAWLIILLFGGGLCVGLAAGGYYLRSLDSEFWSGPWGIGILVVIGTFFGVCYILDEERKARTPTFNLGAYGGGAYGDSHFASLDDVQKSGIWRP